MWMTDYIRAVKCGFRDMYGFVPTGGTDGDPTFESIPDGEYPMVIDGRLDRVAIVDGKIRCCNFDEGGPKP
jgi:hypothetical protein